ncbi:hypothetical protein [Bradyrhizobium sp. 164]|nr:hypothetical protein [Bradyrhizobium sp. 164]MCK1593873.1 hypothetical protein [Bradyrhizobium sp. 164]
MPKQTGQSGLSKLIAYELDDADDQARETCCSAEVGEIKQHVTFVLT